MKRNMNSKAWYLVLMLSALRMTASAQVMTLPEVLETLDRQSPMLQEYDQQAKALEAYAGGAKSWMAPMVGAGTFMTPYPGQMLMDERDKGSWMLSVEQEIPNPAKLHASRDYLQSKAGVVVQSRALRYNQLRAEARTLYYQWLVLEEKKNVLRESEEIVALMLKLARVRYPYNQGNLGDIYKAEGRLEEVRTMQAMNDGEIDARRYQLQALMNMPSGEALQIDTTTVVTFDAQGAVSSDTTALRARRSDIQQIEKSIDVMRLSQQVQRAQAKPDFRLRFDHMQPIGNMPKQFTAMAMISIPIAPWSSKMYRAEIRGMEYDIAAMKKEKEAMLTDARGMLASMAARIAKMEQQLKGYEQKILPALRKSYDVRMLAYEENREQLPMVIDAWETVNMAEMERLNKLEEYYLMIVAYEREAER
jgi:outer membrane protein, heavy metal efflux system